MYRVEKLMYIPMGPQVRNAKKGAEPAAEDKQFIEMIENIQRNKSFYFSYHLDLTKTLQTTLQELVQ